MDSTLLFKTQHTADSTRLYNPNNSFTLSRSIPVPSQTSIPMRPHPAPQVLFPSRLLNPGPSFITPTQQNQTVVFCPVCRRDFFSTQIDQHALLHDSSLAHNLRIENQKSKINTGDISMTTDTSGISQAQSFQYPLVEPMEFWTNQLSDSVKNDIFILKDNSNYNGVDRKLFSTPADHIDYSTQTYRKPPLQYQSNDTNLYNMFDNAVNSRLGPKFSAADLTSHNKIVTPKRHLDEWEVMQTKHNASNNSRNLSAY